MARIGNIDYALVKRDPFARADFVRTANRSYTGARCRECGQPGRFHYAWWADGKGFPDMGRNGSFCSVGCYRAFTGDS